MTFRFLSILALAAPVWIASPAIGVEEAAGAYLAARQARYDSHYAEAAAYALRALESDPDNPELLEGAAGALLATGAVDKALPLAHRMEKNGQRSQIAQMLILGEDTAKGDYADVLERISKDQGVGPLLDGLIGAWATLGEGDMAAALKKFDQVATQPGLRSLAVYHKALALASVGDFEGADKIYSGDAEPIQTTRRSTIAWIEVLSQLDRDKDAIKVLDDTFGPDPDPQIADLRARLVAGERLNQGRIETPRQGIAEVFLSLGMALLHDTSPDYVLLYTRMASYLDPGDVDAQIMTGELLAQLGRYELAEEAYAAVPKDAPAFYTAELGRAEAMRSAGDMKGAIAVVESLRKSHPDIAQVQASAGDLYRQDGDYAKAVAAYDVALRLYSESGGTQPWFVYYSRAISYERQGKWPEAEADFRAALKLNPDQPMVLNYLGYSLVDHNMKLDEALDMIQRAAKAEPDSGAIIDSLGWAQFRLGRYQEAVVTLERAAELYAVDPVVNDHLGDAMWAVGRKTEAHFQWRRALSLINKDDPSPDVDPDRIRKKLEVGLDQVLKDEGAKPLKVSDNEG